MESILLATIHTLKSCACSGPFLKIHIERILLSSRRRFRLQRKNTIYSETIGKEMKK